MTNAQIEMDFNSSMTNCVIHMANCSEMLRSCDHTLNKHVKTMQKLLPATDMPHIKAVVAVVSTRDEETNSEKKEDFQNLFDHYLKATEQLELRKKKSERKYRRKSDRFQDALAQRNKDIQAMYQRMLKEVEEKTDARWKELSQEQEEIEEMQRVHRKKISQPISTTSPIRSSRSRSSLSRVGTPSRRKLTKIQTEIARIRSHVDDITADILRSQQFYSENQEQESKAQNDVRANHERSEIYRDAEFDTHMHDAISSAEREVEILKATQLEIEEQLESKSMRAQYEAEKQELTEEVQHLEGMRSEVKNELAPCKDRLQSLLRTLAPSLNVGTLMTRLYKQLSANEDTSSEHDDDFNKKPTRNTMEIDTFLQTCPSEEEGREAIAILLNMQLLVCYDSNVISLVE